jgi:Holliday junction resolvase RusA-like endonuclease
MSEWSFTVEGRPPSLNHSYRIVMTGKRCIYCGRGPARLGKAPDVETWQTAVAWTAKSARPSGWVPGHRVRVSVEWFAPRRRDCDAGVKALLDALAVGLDMDDAPFLITVISNEVDKANPRTIIHVENEP